MNLQKHKERIEKQIYVHEMKKLGFTFVDIAKKMNVSPSFVGHIFHCSNPNMNKEKINNKKIEIDSILKKNAGHFKIIKKNNRAINKLKKEISIMINFEDENPNTK